MPDYLTSPTCWLLFLGSMAGTIVLVPCVIALARKIGAVDHGGYRKINGQMIPRLGGLAIAVPFFCICLAGLVKPTQMFGQVGGRHADFFILILGGLIITSLGVVDDLRGLGAKSKFCFQILVGLILCAGGRTILNLHLPILGNIHLGAFAGTLLAVLWIVGIVNAFNLVDGLDGLATGLALIAAVGLAAIAWINGQTFTVLLALGLSGSLIGFLLFNFNPARIFLGDSGSMFIGFVLATLALTGSARTSGAVMLLVPILALGFPIFDTITSMARRILRGRNPFVGDCAHTHHRLLKHGYTQRQAALILYAVALMCTISAILCQILYPRDKAPLLAVAIYAALVLGIAWANGYLQLHQIFRIIRCRRRNRKLATFSRYVALAIKADSSALGLEEVLHLICRELNLRLIQLWLPDAPQPFAAIEFNEVESNHNGHHDSVEVIKVDTRDGQTLEICFQLGHHPPAQPNPSREAWEVDKLEHQDVAACLAHLFDHVKLERIMDETVQGQNGLAPVTLITPAVAAATAEAWRASPPQAGKQSGRGRSLAVAVKTSES